MSLRWIRTATGVNVIVKGESKLIAVDHKHYETILAGLKAGDASVLNLIDELKRKINDFSGVDFEIVGGELLFRGKPYHNEVLTEKILKMIERGFDAAPLVRFLEKVEQNPQPESVTMLWDWLQNVGLAIADDGDILGFKYVSIVDKLGDDPRAAKLKAEGAVYTDSHSMTFNMTPGRICEMPRHKVAFDPSKGCAAGLHVGTYNYTKAYRSGGGSQTVVMVKVNPADVVSVPTGEDEKMRCCRYLVLEQFDDVDDNGLKEPVYKVDGTKMTTSDYYKSRTIETAGELDNESADHWNRDEDDDDDFEDELEDDTDLEDDDDMEDGSDWDDDEDEDEDDSFDEDGGQYNQYDRRS